MDLLISDMSFDEKIEKLLAAEDTDEAIKLFQDMVRLGKNIETWSNAGLKLFDPYTDEKKAGIIQKAAGVDENIDLLLNFSNKLILLLSGINTLSLYFFHSQA
ncbi:MAG: hypothetical protein ACI8Y7_001101 [Candidatus Woesearchaeota archaeon]